MTDELLTILHQAQEALSNHNIDLAQRYLTTLRMYIGGEDVGLQLSSCCQSPAVNATFHHVGQCSKCLRLAEFSSTIYQTDPKN